EGQKLAKLSDKTATAVTGLAQTVAPSKQASLVFCGVCHWRDQGGTAATGLQSADPLIFHFPLVFSEFLMILIVQ
ncbi:hypothetical protein A2U01_0069143, partial [Trifolium medium]|nr:hypothetical protein [Trifolium medium]